MAGTTDTQSLRFGQVTDVLSDTTVGNLADDIAVQLTAADTAATGTGGALKRPLVWVRRASGQLYSVGVRAGIAFTTAIADTDAMTNLGTSPLRAAIVGAGHGAGLYMVHGQARLSSSGTPTASHLSVWKNGATLLSQRTMWTQDSGVISVTAQGYLVVGDWIELHYQYDGAGTPTITLADCWVRKLSQ